MHSGYSFKSTSCWLTEQEFLSSRNSLAAPIINESYLIQCVISRRHHILNDFRLPHSGDKTHRRGHDGVDASLDWVGVLKWQNADTWWFELQNKSQTHDKNKQVTKSTFWPKCSTRHQNWMTGADWQFTTRWRETSSFRWMGVDNYTWANFSINCLKMKERRKKKADEESRRNKKEDERRRRK